MKRVLLSLALLAVAIASGCAAQQGVQTGVGSGWSAPANPAPSPALPTAVYEGKLVTGFETSSFSACGTNERWWLEGNDRPIANFLASRSELYSTTALDDASLFVRVRGTPSATGNFGHGGSYPRRLTVDEVLDVRPYADGDCRRPGA